MSVFIHLIRIADRKSPLSRWGRDGGAWMRGPPQGAPSLSLGSGILWVLTWTLPLPDVGSVDRLKQDGGNKAIVQFLLFGGFFKKWVYNESSRNV